MLYVAAAIAAGARLLAVIDQNLIAGLRDLGAVLLQASEDRQVALVDDGHAEFLHVGAAGGFFGVGAGAALLLLGKSSGGQKADGDGGEAGGFDFTIRSSSRREAISAGMVPVDDATIAAPMRCDARVACTNRLGLRPWPTRFRPGPDRTKQLSHRFRLDQAEVENGMPVAIA